MLPGFPAADDAILLISELATNACLYSASGDLGGAFTVRIERFGGHVRVEVEDQGSAWDGDLSKARLPHGLYLMQALSDSCGTYPGHAGLGDLVHPHHSPECRAVVIALAPALDATAVRADCLTR